MARLWRTTSFFSFPYPHCPHRLIVISIHRETVRSVRKKTIREHYNAPVARIIFSSLLNPHCPHWLIVISIHKETVRSVRKKTIREHYNAPAARIIFFLFPIPDPDDANLRSPCHCEEQSGEAISAAYCIRREIASLRSQ